MSAPTTAAQLLELVGKSGLIDAPRLEEYARHRWAAGAPATAAELADALVRDGLLTPFQAEQLLRGRHRHFILSGKYKVLRPLGAGGMGQVFLCEHAVMRRLVAVKLLPPGQAGVPAAVERFRREVRAVSRLHHPNIVTAHDADRDGNLHFLVMEYIDGPSLRQLVKEHGPLPWGQAADYVRQAALGLQHAHEHGLVHRDVKPSNLLVDGAGTVKVLDLGLARFFHDEADDLSRRHGVGTLGTADYVAPEQARDSHAADARADVYSLGSTLYYLLAGRSPFHGAAPHEKALWLQVREPRPIREVRPDVPPEMAVALERMMVKAPAERCEAAEVVEALAPWAQAGPPPRTRAEEPTLPSAGLTPLDVVSALDRYPLDAPAGETATVPHSVERRGTLSGPEANRDRSVLASPEHARPAPAKPPVPEPAPPAEAKSSSPEHPRPSAQANRDRSVLASPEHPRPFRGWAAAIWLAAILVIGGAVGLAVYHATKRNGLEDDGPGPGEAGPRLRLLVPAYFYPVGKGLAEWQRLLKAPDPAAVVIIVNTASGPGTMADPNFTQVIGEARRKGFTLIGYVSTRYAKRSIEEVKEDVDRWVRLYPGVEGTFFDEQTSAADEVDYYAELYEYARKRRGLRLVVNNPGTVCTEEYLSRPCADVVCLVESTKPLGHFRPPAWAASYPAGRFAALLHQVAGAERMKRDVGGMPGKRVGYCFLTDRGLPNPWGELPGYWEEELAAVGRVNER